MPAPGGILAVDLGLNVGWAYGGVRDTRPDFGLWELPRETHIGKRCAALENELEDMMALVRPRRLVMAARFVTEQTSAYMLTGMAVVAEVSAYRSEVAEVEKIAESTARKQVLGRGSFGQRDPDNGNKLIKGSGSKAVKLAAVEWCRNRGWHVPTHDTADACVLWEYDRLVQLGRQQWAPR